MRFSIRYAVASELVRDHDEQFVRGGVLLRVEPPTGAALFQPVELEWSTPTAALRGPGQIVQLIPGVGVAVAFSCADVPGLAEAVAAARAAPDAAGPSVEHALEGDDPSARGAPDPAALAGDDPAAGGAHGLQAKLERLSHAEKLQLALRGTKEQRTLILRDLNKTLHVYVVRNPHLGLDEVVAIAKMATVAPEALVAIGERPEWARRPEVARALVRNPRTPAPLAVRLLDQLPDSELRQLARDPHTRPAVQQAARRKVLG